ncbi:hypothetical protein MTO96_003660 [Rhipicephalus appendiculatus]
MRDSSEARRVIPSSSAPAMLHPDSMNAETASLPGNRRNPLDVFTSMFRRRSLRPAGGPSMTQSSDRIWELLSTSPVRVRNLEQDMEALRQSRHDNPYLQQQMERFSIQDEPVADERQLLFPPDDISDLHKHLIRSPPPQFPQDVAHFVFPGSPPARGRDHDGTRDAGPLRALQHRADAPGATGNARPDVQLPGGRRAPRLGPRRGHYPVKGGGAPSGCSATLKRSPVSRARADPWAQRPLLWRPSDVLRTGRPFISKQLSRVAHSRNGSGTGRNVFENSAAERLRAPLL